MADPQDASADQPLDPQPPAAKRPVPPAVDTERAIQRHDLEAVIRRAVELSLTEHESEDRLSEDEVIRVATEVGLPAKLARQALYELPAMPSTPSFYEKMFGPAIISASRAIPAGDADRLRKRLEEYLHSHEYLQLVRRRAGRLYFVPAEDTISSLARGLLRPSKRYQMARARRVVVDVRALDESSSHVQIATDFEKQRTEASRGAMIGGGAVGAAAGGVAAALIGFNADPSMLTAIGQAAAFLGVGAASLTGVVRLAGRSFRQRMLEARVELEGLLDRAEHGERLEPPPAPWRRRLQRFLGG